MMDGMKITMHCQKIGAWRLEHQTPCPPLTSLMAMHCRKHTVPSAGPKTYHVVPVPLLAVKEYVCYLMSLIFTDKPCGVMTKRLTVLIGSPIIIVASSRGMLTVVKARTSSINVALVILDCHGNNNNSYDNDDYDDNNYDQDNGGRLLLRGL